MRGAEFGNVSPNSLRSKEIVVTVEDGQVAPAELRALEAIDIATHPSDLDSTLLDRATDRFRPSRIDELRLPPPLRRPNTQHELQRRLVDLLSHFKNGRTPWGLPDEKQVQAVGMMLSALGSLVHIQMQIERARKGTDGGHFNAP